MFRFCILPSCVLLKVSILCYHYSSLWYLRVKAQHYFVSLSCILLDKKTLLKIWLNPGLNLTIFRGTGPADILMHVQSCRLL